MEPHIVNAPTLRSLPPPSFTVGLQGGLGYKRPS